MAMARRGIVGFGTMQTSNGDSSSGCEQHVCGDNISGSNQWQALAMLCTDEVKATSRVTAGSVRRGSGTECGCTR